MTSERISAQIHELALDIARPLSTGAGVIAQRDVLLIEVTTADGLVGWGEAAPLPGWPGPDLAATRHQLDVWAANGPAPGAGPARAAVEMAMLDCEAQRAGVPVAQLLAPGAAASVRVNALLDDLDPESIAVSAAAATDQGFEVLKVKVGIDPDDAHRVAAVRAATPAATIRLDANRAWTPEQAIEFCAAVEPLAIEFIEEPIAGGVAALVELQKKVGIDIAADESLAEEPHDALAGIDLPVLVIKPAAIGGFRSLVELGQTRRLVVTSFLDSAIGVAAALHLAAAMPEPRRASGLATSSRFASDIADLPVVENGRLHLPERPGLGVVPHLS